MKVVHVATVPRELDLALMDEVLGGLEKVLVGRGASRIWVDLEDGALAVMAELPGRASDTVRPSARSAVPC